MFRTLPHAHRVPSSPSNSAPSLLAQSGLLLALVLALLFILVLAVLPAHGQTAVPATARQAVSQPRFASRLHPPAQSQSYPRRNPLPQVQYIYMNGPSNGICDIQNCEVDAWTVNFGFSVTDSIGTGGTVNALEFAFWMYPGDSFYSLDWSLGTTPFAADIAYGTATSSTNLTQTELFTNMYGYQIEDAQISNMNVNIPAGAWLTLQNAVTSQGNPVYWDENNGPSEAQENQLGTLPSESFNVQGGPGPGCSTERQQAPQGLRARATELGRSSASPAQGFQLLHTFGHGLDGWGPPAGPTLDRNGDVVGPVGNIYQLSRYGSRWLFSLLYSFLGGNDGLDPQSELTAGPDGLLYGTTHNGGGSGCYMGSGCGTVYRLRPSPSVATRVFAGGSDEILYRFTGGSDGSNPLGRLIFDSAGNIYGTTLNGGLNGFGSVYELTPGTSGWTYHQLYSFIGGAGGASPLSDLMFDQGGNLYGATYTGGFANCGTVYELTPSEGAWTRQTLYAFHGTTDSGNPLGLVMDSSGILYGNTIGGGCYRGVCQQGVGASTVFQLAPSNGSWNYTVLNNYSGLYEADISIDPAGSLYVNVAYPSYVFRLSRSSGSWVYTDLHDFNNDDGFWPLGKLAFDNEGNVYGVTSSGGTTGAGVVYEITP